MFHVRLMSGLCQLDILCSRETFHCWARTSITIHKRGKIVVRVILSLGNIN